MNFFEQQDIARRNTRLLIVLFIVAVSALIFLTLLFLLLFPWQTHSQSFHQGSNQPLMCLMQEGCDFWLSVNAHRDKLWAVSMAILLVVGGGSLYKWMILRKGGKVVAEMLGGREVKANTRDLAEQRFLNVVEEMALAAGMSVPAVYVLDDELGINAFAAGFSTKDAVIAVTEGALYSFNRDQLQGVVAHEFSHIFNGDMRLNMHIIAVLHGIMFITEMGYVFLRSGTHSGSGRRGIALAQLLGLGLVVLGSIGTFFGNLIKAAVSRQREYLADASAVQFTRNPSAIADALKVIGGHSNKAMIVDARAGEASHLFFAQAVSWGQSFFATHPPLQDRIRRIEPRWDGEYLQATILRVHEQTEEKPAIEFESVMVAAAAVVAVAAQMDKPQPGSLEELHEPLSAAAAICCLLLHHEEPNRSKQELLVKQTWPELAQKIQSSSWRRAGRTDFMTVVEISVSALRMFSVEEYKRFKQLLLQLIKSDNCIDLYEWSLYFLLKSSVDCHFGQTILPRPQYKKIEQVENEIRTVIHLLIQSTKQNAECKARALDKALTVCGLPPSTELPKADMTAFTVAIKKLGNTYPLLKARIVKAMVEAAKSDGEIEEVEKYMICAIAAAIDTPVFNLSMPELI